MVISLCRGGRTSERQSEEDKDRGTAGGGEEVREPFIERKKMIERWLQMAPSHSDRSR